MSPLLKMISCLCLAFVLFIGCVSGDVFECPPLTGQSVERITSFISVDNTVNDTTICRMQYEVPQGANLWQGMLAASQQHGDNFTFMASMYPPYGHFITTINGVMGADGYFWAIFNAEGVATPVGVDSLYLQDGSAYIFNYQYAPPYNASNPMNHTITNYTGTCLSGPAIPANMPLAYLSAFITVSGDNTDSVKAGTNFEPVCNRLVLFNQSQPTLYDVMMLVNDQVPLDISVNLSTSDMSVKTLNNITNQGGFAWTPFNTVTKMMLPRDLPATRLSDGDPITFVFIQIEERMGTTMGSSCSLITASIVLLLSSLLGSLYI